MSEYETSFGKTVETARRFDKPYLFTETETLLKDIARSKRTKDGAHMNVVADYEAKIEKVRKEYADLIEELKALQQLIDEKNEQTKTYIMDLIHNTPGEENFFRVIEVRHDDGGFILDINYPVYEREYDEQKVPAQFSGNV